MSEAEYISAESNGAGQGTLVILHLRKHFSNEKRARRTSKENSNSRPAVFALRVRVPTSTKRSANLTLGKVSGSWCKIVDAFQTTAISANEDYRLKHLADVFQLSGNLIETSMTLSHRAK